MLKEYIAHSVVAISVAVSKGHSRRVSFEPIHGGGSRFYTTDPDLQAALERHWQFGKTFVLAPSDPEPAAKAEATDDAPASSGTTIAVKNLTEAKDYLFDQYGISRTKLRTREAVEKIAAEKDIHFVYPA